MKDTTLASKHIELGAKMVPFAGFNMPLQYEGLKLEHNTVRNNVGVFDVSHMGEFFVEGPDALKLLQQLTSNDVSALSDGQVQYSCLPNLDGGIVDDLLVYRFHSEKYMLVVNASNIEKDFQWIQSFNTFDATLTNKSNDYSLLAVQGPKSSEALQALTLMDLAKMKYYTFQTGEFANIKDIIVSATGYTGSGGFEIYVKNEFAEQLWDAIFSSGAEYNIKPIGLAARDTLRLEMGFCLYGNDIDDTTSPIEAGLSWITKFNSPFNNHENLLQQKILGVNKKRVGFVMKEKGIARQGYTIVDEQDSIIGQVTSGTMSPSLDTAIGMGYVTIDFSKVGSTFYVKIRNKKLLAEVVKLPFYRP